MRLYQYVLVILLITDTCGLARGFTARVAGIPDGDTIEVYKPGARFKTTVDLYGIDCPEMQQDFGYAAKEAAAALLGLKSVSIAPLSEDRSGRLSAVITVEGNNVNKILVAKGWAWVIPDGCQQPFCGDWRRLQEEARNKRIGLWSAPKPQPPWEWRKQGKKELFYLSPDTHTPVWRYSP